MLVIFLIGNIITWPPPKGSSNFWLGPKGTVTPLHYDPPSLVHTHIKGHKRWYLVDARDAPKLCNYEGWFSPFDPTDPGDYEKCPSARGVQVYETVVGPGETLFVPSGWFHFVEGLDISATISFTHFTRAGPHAGRKHAYLYPDKQEEGKADSGRVRLVMKNETPNEVSVAWEGTPVSKIGPHQEGTMNTWDGHDLVMQTRNSTGWEVKRLFQVSPRPNPIETPLQPCFGVAVRLIFPFD